MSKKIILLSALLTATFLGYSQYKSLFGDNSTNYLIYGSRLDGWSPWEYPSLEIIEDNGYLYHKFSCGLIREDTVSGKVWGRKNLSSEEILIMDLSLNVGDTMFLDQENFAYLIYEYPNIDYAVVQNIYYDDNGKNIELNCHLYNHLFYPDIVYLKFIEGVGPNYSIFYGHLMCLDQPYLLCSYKDDTLTYVNTEFNTCDSTIFGSPGGVKDFYGDKRSPEIQCVHYPNIDYSSYDILFSNSFSGIISLYSINGRKLFSYQIDNELSIKVSLENFESGVYILNLSNNTSSHQLKLIKL